MNMDWIEKVTGSFEDKKRYKAYKARVAALPPAYRTANEALERYFLYFGGISKGEVLVQMNEDLVELFEQSAENHTAIRDIVGENPVEFAEAFLQNYAEGQWINKERARLIQTIDGIAET